MTEAKGKFQEVIIFVSDLKSYQMVESAVKGIGGKVNVGNPYESMISKVPEGKEVELKSIEGVRLISAKPVEIEKLKGFNEREINLLKEWNKRFKEIREPTLVPEPPPPPNDALKRPDIKPEEVEPKAPKSLPKSLDEKSF
jgi:hypothetical protein